MQAAHFVGNTRATPSGGGFAHHARWAFAGYGVGLILFLPWIIWLTAPAAVVVEQAAPTSRPTLVEGPRQVSRKTPADAAAEERARLLAAARDLLASRAIGRIRAVLAPLVEAGDAEALFLTAQTYDPVQLAVLGIVDVPADADRARHLYGRALAAGFEAAQGRLDQLR